MITASFDDVDDAILEVASARIEDGIFLMDGHVDWVLDVPRRPPLGRHRARFVVTGVHRFWLADDERIGVFIPESMQTKPGLIRITGVIPATLTLFTRGPREVRFDLDDQPFEVRRRFRWRPA